MADAKVPKKPKRAPSAATTRAAAVRNRKALMQREKARAGSFAMVQPQRARVTSAAMQHVGQTQARRQQDKPWQSRAYELVDGIGELGYLLNTKANMVADCNLLVQGLDEEANWTTTDHAGVLRTLASFVGPQGGQRELKRRAALHLSTAGETHLLGSVPEEEGDVGIVWEFLSTDELREEGHGFIRLRDGAEREQLPAESYLARCWRSHARFSDLADSELRRVIPIAEEVLVLTQLVDAIAKSRLSAGLLYVPNEITFSGEDDEAEDIGDGDTDEDDGIDEFTKRLIQHMAAPVEDRTSAAALVPLVMRGPAAIAENVRLIDLARSLDTWAQDLRQEALGRLATGLDSPPEIMSGKSGLAGLGGGNVAQSIDTEFIVKHIIPLGELLADFLTFAYLRPMLETFEGMTAEQAMLFRIAFDPSPIQSTGDEGGAAERLHKQAPDLVSNESVRNANGLDDSDAPGDDEILERRKWSLITTAPQVFAKALLPTIKGFESIDLSLLETGEEPAVPGVGVLAPTGEESDVLPAVAALRLSLAVAADAMLERAVDRAATKVCSRANKLDVETKAAVKAASKQRVLQLLTAEHLTAMGLDTEALLEGAWTPLVERARTWTKVHLVEQGLDTRAADEFGAKVAARLAVGLHDWTSERLHEGFGTRYQGFRMPIDVVDAALAVLDEAPVPANA